MRKVLTSILVVVALAVAAKAHAGPAIPKAYKVVPQLVAMYDGEVLRRTAVYATSMSKRPEFYMDKGDHVGVIGQTSSRYQLLLRSYKTRFIGKASVRVLPPALLMKPGWEKRTGFSGSSDASCEPMMVGCTLRFSYDVTPELDPNGDEYPIHLSVSVYDETGMIQDVFAVREKGSGQYFSYAKGNLYFKIEPLNCSYHVEVYEKGLEIVGVRPR